MKTIKENSINEIVVNKSRFIGCIYKVYNEEDVINYLTDIKSMYKDATHYCYAYIIDNNKRFNDDGEPGGTAGIPIMEVLAKNQLNYVLCVIIRYFGGVKLGAGGLVRSYTKASTGALKKTLLLNLIKSKKLEIIFNYDNNKDIDYILSNYIIEEKYYDNNIKYIVNIPIDDVNNLINHLNNFNNIKINELNNSYIEL